MQITEKFTGETGEECRQRIRARDQRMRVYLSEHDAGTCFPCEVVFEGEDVNHG